MTGELGQRRLAAILAADVEGFSRLVGADETAALTELSRLRHSIIEPNITKHRGRLFKIMGDGFLVEFASAVQAVDCAKVIQDQTESLSAESDDVKKMRLRIGIHVGDVVVDGDDLMGDGVNIAARLEGIAASGSICISRAVHEQVRDRVKVNFEDQGEVSLKNISRPVHIFTSGGLRASSPTSTSSQPLALPNKPSIAVLPFQNMSGDAEQEYFAEGIVDDIITALSRFKSLFVIARNSSFTYRGKTHDIKTVGRELGVRYVLEGSVRKASGRIRITGQLIDASTGAHLWADRFEGNLQDIFELQDQVAISVVGELTTQVQFAEMQRAKRKPTNNLDAYDCYIRGMEHLSHMTKDDIEAALAYFVKAIELDENFALAHACAGQMYVLRKQSRWMDDVERESIEAVRLARRAIDLGAMDDMAQCMGGYILAYIAGELDVAEACIRRGLSMNENLAVGWNFSGWVQTYLGNHRTALEHQYRAARLSPRDPNMMHIRLGTAYSHMFNGDFDDAVYLGKRIVGEFPAFASAWRVMAVASALCDDMTTAKRAASKALEFDAKGRIAMLTSQMPLRRREDRERWNEGLHRAGFPP